MFILISSKALVFLAIAFDILKEACCNNSSEWRILAPQVPQQSIAKEYILRISQPVYLQDLKLKQIRSIRLIILIKYKNGTLENRMYEAPMTMHL